MFAAGYVCAEDRLFFIDVLRHLGRAQLASFAGGAQGNRDFDQSQWQIAPYTEEDLQSQIDAGANYGEVGKLLQEDLRNYVDGINRYILEARLNPLKMPGEYAAINQPWGPADWKGTDIIATASLVGGIFGKGGGEELESGRLLQSFQGRFGDKSGRAAWLDFRAADDPEAPTTVRGRNFPYRASPKKVAPGSVALPDAGSLTPAKVVTSASGSAAGDAAGSRRPRASARGIARRASPRTGPAPPRAACSRSRAPRPTPCSSRRASPRPAGRSRSSARRWRTSPRRS